MSFLAGGIANVVGQGAGLSKSAGLLQELTGQPGRVQLVQDGVGCVLEFDACINEQHGREATVTTNPIESGSVVSDHIIVNPVTLSLTGVKSDTPLYDKDRFLRQTIGNAVTAFLPPLGVVTATSAYTYGQRAAALDDPANKPKSPSKQAYDTLMRLVAGDPSTTPPMLPQLISVLTAYARYPDMVIKSLSIPRDAGTSGQLVFTIQLQQIQVVSPQVVDVAKLKNPALGAGKKVNGELEAEGKEIDNAVDTGLVRGRQDETQTVTPVINAADRRATAVGY